MIYSVNFTCGSLCVCKYRYLYKNSACIINIHVPRWKYIYRYMSIWWNLTCLLRSTLGQCDLNYQVPVHKLGYCFCIIMETKMCASCNIVTTIWKCIFNRMIFVYINMLDFRRHFTHQCGYFKGR